MIKKIAVLVISLGLLLSASAVFVQSASAQSQGSINVNSSSVSADYPASLTFSCRAQSNVNITEVRLEYQVEQISFAKVTAQADTTFTPALSVQADYTLDMQRYGQIPPGTNIDYRWVVKDTAGDVFQSTE